MRREWTRVPRAAARVLKLTIDAFLADHASLMAASLAFYSLISIAPLLILLVSAVGAFYGPETARGSATGGLAAFLGPDAGVVLDAVLRDTAVRGTSWTATLIGIAIVLYGSMRVFTELQRSLRVIWRDPEKPAAGFHPLLFLKTQLGSFLMVLGTGVLWFVGIAGSTLIEGLTSWMADVVPAELRLADAIHTAASIALITLSVGLVYRFLSGRRARRADVWLGAGLTAVLIAIGQEVIGTYLGSRSIRSVYGAAGSIILVLFWFYYSWLIFFFGAEFTKVWATKYRRAPVSRSRSGA